MTGVDLVTLLLAVLAGVGAFGLVVGIRLQRTVREMAAQTSALQEMLGALQHAEVVPPARYFYMRPGGMPQGPTELTTLRAMLADGRLGGGVYVAEAGSNDWHPMAEVLGDELRLPFERRG